MRDSSAFVSGHINGSFNVRPADLLNYIEGINTSQYPKIVLVSESGQSAAYYASLLRLYGIDNIFSMNFGMAIWNIDFSSVWMNAIIDIGFSSSFEAALNPKLPYTSLPKINFSSSNLSDQQKLVERVNILLQEGFGDYQESPASVYFESMFGDLESYFIVCYGPEELYYSKAQGVLHPQDAVHFYPPPVFSDFRSIRYLQTLPNDNTIAMYSIDGQLSAHTTAYLRLLGYNVKSILFGAHNMFYGNVRAVPTLQPYVFKPEQIENFPYVIGP